MSFRRVLAVMILVSLSPVSALQPASAQSQSKAAAASPQKTLPPSNVVSVVNWRERLNSKDAANGAPKQVAMMSGGESSTHTVGETIQSDSAKTGPITLSEALGRPAKLLMRGKEACSLAAPVEQAVDGFSESASRCGKVAGERAVDVFKWMSDLYGQFTSCPTVSPGGSSPAAMHH